MVIPEHSNLSIQNVRFLCRRVCRETGRPPEEVLILELERGKMMEVLFLVSLFVIAFFYSSIGHGGASGYLAIMALFGIETIYMKPSALTLNLFVSGIAFYHFYKGGFFSWKIILPFIITSIPLAFIGAKIHVETKTYQWILGIFLSLAAARIIFSRMKESGQIRKVPFLTGLLTGALLGFFAGMIGIGGGIILSPVLIIMGWANMKQAAAVSALFILLNSAAGLLGVYYSGARLTPDIVIWVILAFAGGTLGGYLGSRKFTQGFLRYILAGIMILASLKLIIY
jgi:uncharacterized membrane protein YfcA